MAKKLKAGQPDDDTQLADAVRASAQQIWQAGLAAFAKAQQEGGRVFSKLVKEGTELQQRADDKVPDTGGTAGKQAVGSWDKLEQIFEERVARALAKIGVPNQHDVDALQQRVEQLSQLVAQLSATQAPVVGKPAATVVAKPATKPAPKAAAVATAPAPKKAAPRKPRIKPAA